ncbi:uncharacterized protein AKAW2_70935A [Aspergillus luchuensis]|uniref:Uncharacterized protein n=1 Tax=Aspergillus kawachii TaxID=1069201 RepID=A0A7R7WJ94_ASPKA|nr:uncharacterized protein AKAW2_70935A [Aspergillus luchuensis]BCS04057.1 hypothetical protein AKAW2_70935A [Aspergillus luchuensis]
MGEYQDRSRDGCQNEGIGVGLTREEPSKMPRSGLEQQQQQQWHRHWQQSNRNTMKSGILRATVIVCSKQVLFATEPQAIAELLRLMRSIYLRDATSR